MATVTATVRVPAAAMMMATATATAIASVISMVMVMVKATVTAMVMAMVTAKATSMAMATCRAMARHNIRLCANKWESSGLKRVWKVRTLKFFFLHIKCLRPILPAYKNCSLCSIPQGLGDKQSPN